MFFLYVLDFIEVKYFLFFFINLKKLERLIWFIVEIIFDIFFFYFLDVIMKIFRVDGKVLFSVDIVGRVLEFILLLE